MAYVPSVFTPNHAYETHSASPAQRIAAIAATQCTLASTMHAWQRQQALSSAPAAAAAGTLRSYIHAAAS